MNDQTLCITKPSDISYNKKLEYLEDYLLDLQHVECPIAHHFGPGIYIREVFIPAGSIVLGHAQRFEQLNIVLQGAISTANSEGEIITIRAPLIFVGPPGRKFGVAIEDTIWQNVYSTDETDIEKLEEMFLDKSETWKKHEVETMKQISALNAEKS